jgi:MFS family permease
LKEGLKYVLNEKNVRLLLLNLGVISTFGFSLMTLMPAWAVKILGGDVTTNGLLLSARGVGSLLAALFIAYLGSRGFRGKIWTVGWLLMPLFLAGFAFVRWLPGSLALLVGVGWCLMSIVNVTNSMIQTQIPDNLRGRVMGVYSLVFMGTLPVGSLLVGALASKFGETITVVINAIIVLLVASATFIFQPGLRKLQ